MKLRFTILLAAVLLGTAAARAQTGPAQPYPSYYSAQATDVFGPAYRPSTSLPGQFTPLGSFTVQQIVNAGLTGATIPAPTATAYAILGNNTAASANATSLQQLILGTPTNFSEATNPYYIGQLTVSSALQGNTFTFFSLQGLNAGAAASTEFLVNADNATSTTHYVTFGINSSGYSAGGTATYPFGANNAFLISGSDALFVGTATTQGVTLFANNIAFLTGSSAGAVALPLLTTNGTLVTSGGAGAVSVVAVTPAALSVGFSIAGGTTSKTLTVSNTLTLAGTDGTTMTFPGTSATVARTDAANTFTGASSTTSWAMTTQVVTGGLTASGSGANDFSASTGTFLTSTGANTLSGATTINDATTPSLTTATGKTNTGFLQVNGKTSGSLKITTADATAQTVTLTVAAQTTGGATITMPNTAGVSDTLAYVTLAQTLASKTLTSPVISTGLTASGSTANDFSGSSGTFKTSTGAVTIGTGAVSITGALTITGPTATTALTLTNTARTSGVLPYIKYTIPTDTAQTASTESPGIQGVTGTRTWATTGTVALQREIYWPGPTYASASASQTFTDVFNTYWDKPIAGSNAIFTRGHTLGVVDSTSSTTAITGGVIVATTLGTAATSVGIGGGNITAGGAILASTSTGRIGYLVGSGVGTAVTQLTSRTTSVTSNTPTGAITLFAAAGSATPATFTVDCTSIAVGDTVIISEASGTDQYIATCSAISAGASFNITFYSEIGTTSDSPVLNYTIIKGSST